MALFNDAAKAGRTLNASDRSPPLFTDIHFDESLKIDFFLIKILRGREARRKRIKIRETKEYYNFTWIFYYIYGIRKDSL